MKKKRTQGEWEKTAKGCEYLYVNCFFEAGITSQSAYCVVSSASAADKENMR